MLTTRAGAVQVEDHSVAEDGCSVGNPRGAHLESRRNDHEAPGRHDDVGGGRVREGDADRLLPGEDGGHGGPVELVVDDERTPCVESALTEHLFEELHVGTVVDTE